MKWKTVRQIYVGGVGGMLVGAAYSVVEDPGSYTRKELFAEIVIIPLAWPIAVPTALIAVGLERAGILTFTDDSVVIKRS